VRSGRINNVESGGKVIQKSKGMFHSSGNLTQPEKAHGRRVASAQPGVGTVCKERNE